MNLQIDYQDSTTKSTIQNDRGARIFVWSIWLAMILIAFVSLARYGRNIPLAEDWYFVSPLTGNEPHLASWLWAQNNEHRIPLPRLILLGLIKLANGDFRAGMVLNIVALGGLSLAMIRVAHSLRQGRTSWADAFFPLALLHLGNWENLFWGWQFSFVLSVVLTCTILLVLVSNQTVMTAKAAVVAGIALLLLPLCGATGLAFVPLLALWLGYCGILHWNQVKTNDGRRWVSVFLIGSAVVALVLTGLYFVGYEHPTWNPPNPGLIPSLKTAAKFLALGFGPAVEKSWPLSTTLAISILVVSGVVATWAVFRQKGLERYRALGLLLFFGNIILFILVMGWGRAGAIAIYGRWPLRYVLLAVQTFCVSFYVWELYGSPKLRTIVQMGLLVVMCLLLRSNTNIGLDWGRWYRGGMDVLEQDIAAGTPRSILVEKHREFLIHWWSENQLTEGMQMLHDAGIGPFAQMQAEPAHSESATLK
jgi:hypothetical protein